MLETGISQIWQTAKKKRLNPPHSLIPPKSYPVNKTFLMNWPWTDEILHKCNFLLSFNVKAGKQKRGHFHKQKPFKTTLFITCQWLPETDNGIKNIRVQWWCSKDRGNCKFCFNNSECQNKREHFFYNRKAKFFLSFELFIT